MPNHLLRFPAALLGIVLAVFAWPALAGPQIAGGDAAFRQLADQFIDNFLLPQSPTFATQLGVHTYDEQLEDYSRANIDRQVVALKKYESKIVAVDPATLSVAVAGDRDILLGAIRSQLLTLESIKPWEKNPDLYSSGITGTAFVMMSKKFAPPAERLRALIAREKLMPKVFADARANLRNPPKIYTEIALEQLPGLATFFKNDVPLAFADVADPSLKQQFGASNAAVIQALGEYEQWLRKELLAKSQGDFKIGAQAYAKKLAYDEMVETPLAELLVIGMQDLRRNQAEFARIAKELDASKTAQQVLADITADHPAPAQLLDTFRSRLDGLVRFIEDKHIVTIPSSVRPIVEETPPFSRATTFASMDTPGPFETVAKEAYFNVTVPDSQANPQAANELMTQFNNPVITGIAIHEAYPGHYIQFLVMHEVPSRVRKIFGAATNAEGWAHYCEQMMLDEGLGQVLYPNDLKQQKRLRLGQLQEALLRNARYIVGIKLHTGEFTFDQAVDFFVKEGYQSHAVGVVETKRGTGDPTYLYYTLGKIEILKLREDLRRKQGAAFNLQRFHDEFLHQGNPPIKIVRRALLGDDSPAL